MGKKFWLKGLTDWEFDIIIGYALSEKRFRGVAQMVACLVRDQEAMGSNPVTPTKSGVHSYEVMNARFFVDILE